MNRFFMLILVVFMACNQKTSDKEEVTDFHPNGNKLQQIPTDGLYSIP